MRPEDAKSMAEIEKQIFTQPWSENGFLDALHNPAALFLVADNSGAEETEASFGGIVGYIGLYYALDEGEITNVAVSDTFRCKGIGRQLLQSILAEAVQKGIARIVLEVRVSNQTAIRLYEKNGFKKIGLRKGFYEFPKEDADIMVWESHQTNEVKKV
jgi:ribosomal-protein-alanine N-acetyltransferase